jgi:hypothetical protein
MKNKYILFFPLIAWAIISSCSIAIPTKTREDSKNIERRLSVAIINQLKIGHTSTGDAQAMLGVPDKILRDSKAVESEVWLYLVGGYPKSSLIFDKKSSLLISATWDVGDSDPEIDLNRAKSLFPGANFVAKNAPWIGHSGSDETNYVDRTRGWKIVFLRSVKRVDRIVWFKGSEE